MERDVPDAPLLFMTSAARYSNLCTLWLSWAADRARTRLHRLIASRDAPVVCI